MNNAKIREATESLELKACRSALMALQPKYTPGGFLGRGSFGIVYEIFDSSRGNAPCAAKIIAPHSELDFFINDDAIRELRNTLMVPPSPYVIAFQEVVILSNFTVLFIMPRYDCTLCTVFKYEKLNAACIRSLFYQLASGMAVLHGADICHRDLKPANIFVDLETGGVVIGDLGVARHRLSDYAESGQLTGEVATCGYAPIETLLPVGRYDRSMDMWSLGVILCEAMIGRQPFPQCVDRAAHVKVILGMHGVPPKCVEGCTHCNPCPGSHVVKVADARTCTRWFLQEICMQVISASASALPSRVEEMLYSVVDDDDDEPRTLVSGMLRYVPERRLDITAVTAMPYVADFVDDPATRSIASLKRLLYHAHTALREPASGNTRTTTSTRTVRVLAAFCVGKGERAPKLTPTARLMWPLATEAGRNILMHLLTALVDDAVHCNWCIEAWLTALCTANILPYEEKGENLERLAAYLTYGLSCATPSVLEEPYNRFQWLDNLPGSIDIVHVARQEAYIIGELGKRGLVPLVNVSVLKQAKDTLLSELEIRTFCRRTILGDSEYVCVDDLFKFL